MLRSRPSSKVVVRQRGAEPLEAAEGDQRALGPGEPVEQRADGKEHEARHEEAAPAEQVGHPPAEQERAAEEDRVGGDDPLQALLGEVQVGLDRGEGDVHDRDVQNDHELGGDDERQREPLPPVWVGLRRRDSNGLRAHSMASKIVDAANYTHQPQ